MSTPPTLLHVFPTLAVGGQQTRFVTVANGLGRAFRHCLVTLDGDASSVALLDRNLDVELLPSPSRAGGTIGGLRSIVAVGKAMTADALITYNWGAIEWALINRSHFHLPHIHLEDGFGSDEIYRQKWRRVLFRRLVLPRSTLIVPSRTLAAIARTRWRLDPRRIAYIPNGIDPIRFDDISRSGAPFFTRRGDDCIIGSFSPLRPEKNIGRLLRAFAAIRTKLATARLVICGEGPERQFLGELAHGLGIARRVTFSGQVPRPEAVMGGFDLFALSSDTEQMPYAVLEAMAARLPVVATAVGDVAAMVAPENRPFIVEPRSVQGLASALAKIGADQELRGTLGEANRRHVEQHFGVAGMVDAFHRLLIEVLRLS